MSMVGDTIAAIKLLTDAVSGRKSRDDKDREEVINLIDRIADCCSEFADEIEKTKQFPYAQWGEFCEYVQHFRTVAEKVIDPATVVQLDSRISALYHDDAAYHTLSQSILPESRFVTQVATSNGWPASTLVDTLRRQAGGMRGLAKLLRAGLRRHSPARKPFFD